MKPIIIGLIVWTCLLSMNCNQSAPDGKTRASTNLVVDSSPAKPVASATITPAITSISQPKHTTAIQAHKPKYPTVFIVNDSTKYSPIFLEDFKNAFSYVGDTIILSHDSIITSLPEPVLIPTDLPLNQTIKYKGTLKDTLFQLSLTRINYSSVAYRYQTSTTKPILIKVGVVNLDAHYYLGCEALLEDGDDAWGMNHYDDLQIKGETFSIFVAVGSLKKTFTKTVVDSPLKVRYSPWLEKQ